MNNIECQCLDFIGEVLTNRPTDFNKGTTSYKKDDKEAILKTCQTKKKMLKDNRNCISESSYHLLLQLYDIMLELLKNNII